MNFSDRLNHYSALAQKLDHNGKIVSRIFFVLTLSLFVYAVYDIGFSQLQDTESFFNSIPFRFLFPATGLFYLVRSLYFTGKILNGKVFLTNSGLGILVILLFLIRLLLGESTLFKPFAHNFSIFHFFAIFLFVLEISRLKLDWIIRVFNPAQLFILSFLFIIVSGTFMLAMPQSTYSPITFTEAFFTSTSAVCVTGLTVVDTATRFTPLGKLIILVLIQIGGIGVVTITSFFGFFFKETSSFREQMLLRDYLSEESFTGIIKTMIKVIVITFTIEIIGAFLIYLTMQTKGLGSDVGNIRFAIFNSVSAFCNAGFSTLTDNLYDARIRENFFLHYSIAGLIILGGLGFPVFLNIYSYLKAQAIWLRDFFRYGKPYVHRVGMITFNTKIVTLATLALLIAGIVVIFFLEYNSTQQGEDMNSRMAMSFFMSVTPRTAGFNTVNMEALAKPTVFFLLFLMWVGASPVSTGGGIKTSTFGIALLNIIRIIRGKNHIEILHREIHEYSVNKAFAIVIMSLLIIGMGSFAISLLDGQFALRRIVFECFSAFGTVGLSLNLTPLLSTGSKWILIALMFLGRMGILTLLLSLSGHTSKKVWYRYPKENLIIT